MVAPADNVKRTSVTGEFLRHDAKHRTSAIADAPTPGRYHLYVALACPWADGALSMLFLKGLDKAIGHSIVHPTWQRTRPDDPTDQHAGWVFRSPGDDPLSGPTGMGSLECDDALVPDTVNHVKNIRELYELSGDMEGPFTTPVLWDSKTKKIVSNESRDILRILNSDFNSIAEKPEIDLYPAECEDELVRLDKEIVYHKVNNGVYRSGFAKSQAAYNTAVKDVFTALDQLETILGKRRFLGGDKFTWLDLRLYHTLVRFDPVYTVYFKTNERRIADYPNLLGFVRDVYSIEPVRRSTNIKHIKMHYYTSHPHLNPYAIIPIHNGPDLTVAHGRDSM